MTPLTVFPLHAGREREVGNYTNKLPTPIPFALLRVTSKSTIDRSPLWQREKCCIS